MEATSFIHNPVVANFPEIQIAKAAKNSKTRLVLTRLVTRIIRPIPLMKRVKRLPAKMPKAISNDRKASASHSCRKSYAELGASAQVLQSPIE